MPLRLKTVCRYPGCGAACRGGYCDRHRRHASYRPADQRRGSAKERGYDDAWRRLANYRRRLDNYLCQRCLIQENRLVPSETVDHILPVHVRPDWRLELRNTQVLCHRCHRAKTNDDNRTYGSSTQRTLSLQQMENRRRAQGMTTPPRAEERTM